MYTSFWDQTNFCIKTLWLVFGQEQNFAAKISERSEGWYISCKGDCWLTLWDKNCLFLSVKFENALSQRVFIVSRASKYMLKLKFQTFKKSKNFWSWPTSFVYFPFDGTYVIFEEQAIFWRIIGTNEVAQLQKFLIF